MRKQGGLCPKEESEIGTLIGRWDGTSICCHIRKEVGQAVLGILRSSAQVMLEMEVMAPDLAGSYMDAPSWAIYLEWHSLLLRGMCIAKGMQRYWVICCACAPEAVSMPGAPSKVGMVFLYAGAHECCDDTQGDWYTGMA